MENKKPIRSFTLLEFSKSPMRTKYDRYCHESQVRELETDYNELETRIDDLKNISDDHTSYLKALSEAETRIEAMKCCSNCKYMKYQIDSVQCNSCIRSRHVKLQCMTEDNWQIKETNHER